jgi:hypothetical protein
MSYSNHNQGRILGVIALNQRKATLGEKTFTWLILSIMLIRLRYSLST